MTLQEVRERFLCHLSAERGYSPLTIVAYRSDLNQFIDHQATRAASLRVAEIEASHIRAFVAALAQRGLKPPTITRRINCLRSFFGFLVTNDYLATSPTVRIKSPKKARKLPVTLTEQECRRLLDAAYQSHYTMLGFRDRAVLSLLLYTGLRRQELLELELDDVDLRQGWLRVRRGKGGKMRMVPLAPEAISAVEDWLEFRPQCRHEGLFATLTGKRLGRHGLQALFRKALLNAGTIRPGLTVHSMRHTFASLLLCNGCDLMSIKEMLGHASLESTAIYLHIEMASLKVAINRHPLAAVP